jgi:DNA sulfur modification protein DndB
MAQTIKVVKGTQFGTTYWSGKLTLASVARDVLPPNDKFWDPIFDPTEGAQRELNRTRVVDKMVPYLLTRKHPFFSAITVVLVPIDGDELVEGRDYKFNPSEHDPDVGELVIQDRVSMFPADGQHRREAIAQAFAERRGIHSEEVPVIFVPFVGADRVRQMFADLNLHAKPANKSIGLAYEGHDPVVVIVKRVIQIVPLFENGKRVNMKSNSLPAKSAAVISLASLVEGTKSILGALLETPIKDLASHPDLVALAGMEPGDRAVRDIAQRVADVWEVVIGCFPQWTEVEKGQLLPGVLRDGVKTEDGKEVVEPGYIFAFGLGWQALALVAAAIIRMEADDWSEALQRAITLVDWQKGKDLKDVAMVQDRVNNTGPGIKATAGFVLHRAEYGDADDEDIQDLIKVQETLAKPQVPAAAA